ncbi:MAG: glycosyltransferase [Bacteroidales bacterium]|nr:glycosyltransferase [Bacteroidales bacterium]
MYSIVSPVYGCAQSLVELYTGIINVFDEVKEDFEIVFVNDGSKDNAWSIIRDIAKKDKRVLGINLTRNFGQHNAITAGLLEAKGDWVIVMDCDGQDDPVFIKDLILKKDEGFDYVLAQRISRKDNFIKRIFSNLFHAILNYLSGQKWDRAVANFGIYSKNVINDILKLNDSIRWLPTFILWVGYDGTKIPVKHSARIAGKSSYNFRKLLRIALDVVILNSDKPLRIIMKAGLFTSVFAFVYSIIILIQYFSGSIQLIGWTTIILLITFFSGIIIFVLGVLGLYLAKVFNQTKERPVYLIKEKTKFLY